jgi:hypothetical protein
VREALNPRREKRVSDPRSDDHSIGGSSAHTAESAGDKVARIKAEEAERDRVKSDDQRAGETKADRQEADAKQDEAEEASQEADELPHGDQADEPKDDDAA